MTKWQNDRYRSSEKTELNVLVVQCSAGSLYHPMGRNTFLEHIKPECDARGWGGLEQELQNGIWFGRNIILICFLNWIPRGAGTLRVPQDPHLPQCSHPNLTLKIKDIINKWIIWAKIWKQDENTGVGKQTGQLEGSFGRAICNKTAKGGVEM